MAIFSGLPPSPPPPPPSGRYVGSNPLRREYGLRLLTCNLPEPLRAALVRALRRPPRFQGEKTPLAVQSGRRLRPDEGQLAKATLQTKCTLVLTELEVTWRVLEAPLGSISRMTRNTLLVSQGAYLRRLYLALVEQLGDVGLALTEFQRALDAIG